MTDAKRIILELSPEAIDTLDYLAGERGDASYAEVIRRAIGTERMLVEAAKSGRRAYVENDRSGLSEIMILNA